MKTGVSALHSHLHLNIKIPGKGKGQNVKYLLSVLVGRAGYNYLYKMMHTRS